MIYVFDASFIGALIIVDEKNPRVDKMYEKITNEDIKFAPHLIWYEMSSIFYKLIQHNRFTYNQVMLLFPHLSAVRLTDDYETGADYSQKLLKLCADYNLSSYDASYLELAERKKAILCTLDKGLYTAAKKHGVTVLK